MERHGGWQMKHSTVLIITSLLSVLFLTFHLAGDVVMGFEQGGPSYLMTTPIFAVWLYGIVVLAERRSGYVIAFLGSLLGMLVPIVHMKGKGLASQIANHGGGFLFCWTLIALGVTALFSLVLSVEGLWTTWRRPRASA
jgi:hypothetical protein